jgi:hypothetical protein
LTGKLIFRDISDEKLAWDTELPEQLQKLWNKWYNNLPASVTIPRPIAPHQQPIQELSLHAFGDAIGKGVSAVVYAVVKQDDGVAHNIVTAKSRLAKRGLTIPRLELVAGHMAANLITNVQQAIQPIITADLHCWLDSTVALFWILGTGEYKQFVANRVNKIRQHSSITWHHVPTAENPADLGSRGGSVVDAPLWRYGPQWLADPDKWPPNITLISSASSNAEAKITKDIFAAAVNVQDTFDELLSKHELWKVLRIGAWVQRFIHNCKATVATRESGPLTTTEIENHKTWWIERIQRDAQTTARFLCNVCCVVFHWYSYLYFFSVSHCFSDARESLLVPVQDFIKFSFVLITWLIRFLLFINCFGRFIWAFKTSCHVDQQHSERFECLSTD